MSKTKGRISRFHGITIRKPGILLDGKYLEYDPCKIERALAFNDDLSNQFIINLTPRRDTENRPKSKRSLESSPLFANDRKIRKRVQRKKKVQPAIDFTNNPDVEKLNTIFGEVEDFDLLTEVIPKERYVLKTVQSPEVVPKTEKISFWENTANEKEEHVDDCSTSEVQQTQISSGQSTPEKECSTSTSEMQQTQISSGQSTPDKGLTISSNIDIDCPSIQHQTLIRRSTAIQDQSTQNPSFADSSIFNEKTQVAVRNLSTCSSDTPSPFSQSHQADSFTAIEEKRHTVSSYTARSASSITQNQTSLSTANVCSEQSPNNFTVRSASPSPDIRNQTETVIDGVSTELTALMVLCEQETIVNWDLFLKTTCSVENSIKLGEGTYGEVFKVSLNNISVAMKVIPFAINDDHCRRMVNGDYLNPPKLTYNELLITRELSRLADETQCTLQGFVTPTFIRLVHSTIVKGNYPNSLLEVWDQFKKEKPNLAENQRPDEYAQEDQHFIVIALADGGRDLESYKIRNGRESFSIFYQMTLSLAIAEEALEFEHRDLHVGNILIDHCPEKRKISYFYEGELFEICSCGVVVSIIDFTLSRMKKGDAVVYVDVSDDENLFQQHGDYQFEIYRMMRNENHNNWSEFTPRTNLFWLHYLADKLFNIPRLFRDKRRKELTRVFDKLLKVERIRDFLIDEDFLKLFNEFRIKQCPNTS